MKTFLISYTVSVSEYMIDQRKIQNSTINVEAESEDKAVETLRQHLKNKSDDYGTQYYLTDWCVTPTIKQSEILK